MRVLIIGADTPVGIALRDHFDLRGNDYAGLPKADCRWKNERQTKKSLRRSDCRFVVDARLQAAADGGIRIHDIDVDRGLWLARASQALKIPLMHLSAARVFAGTEGRVYGEEDDPDGESTIARLLIAAESALRDSCERYVLLRTGPVFSSRGINVVTHMLNRLHGGEVLHLNGRHQGCPLPAEDAARVIGGMIDQFDCGVRAWGTYHYCSSDITNCYEFAEVLLAAASQYREISPDAARLIAKEADAVAVSRSLDCRKIRDTFAIKQQPWRANIAGHVKQYFADLSAGESKSVESYGHRNATA